MALTSTTQLATTAYTDNAVGVEASRAQTAEALALPKAGGTMSGVIAMGAHKITGGAAATAGTDIPIYSQTAAGGTIVSGQYLCTPTSYAPGTLTSLSTSSATLAAVSSASVNTGSFAAPPSGSVTVSVTCTAVPPANVIYAFALAAHGTVTPVVGNVITGEVSSANARNPLQMQFLVTGLTPATSYNFDLLFATASSTMTVPAIGQTSVTPTATVGAPVLMSVQAV